MTSTLPDRAIVDPAEDQLGRAAFARSLADMILQAPREATLRIGVYGGWGEGKTSVLSMMQTQLALEGHVCVWLVPWVYTSEDDLADQLISKISQALDISLKKLRVKKAAARGVRQLFGTLDVLDSRLRLADVVIGSPVEGFLKKAAKGEEARLQTQITSALRGRKLIVFVDDLDRVRPPLVPGFLLAIREILDRPDFFYVVALAPDLVERSLGSVHEDWGSAYEFLDKIIELPTYLPEVTPRVLDQFVQRQLARLDATIDAGAISTLAEHLPRNPRKLKLFLRYLASLGAMIRRFDPGELAWQTFYLVQLLKIEFPRESRALARDQRALAHIQMSDTEDYIAEQYAKRGEDNPRGKNRPEERYAPEDQPARDRFLALCGWIRARSAITVAGYSVSDLFGMPEEAPAVTLREALDLIESVTRADPAQRSNAIGQFTQVDKGVDSAKAAGLWHSTLTLRQARLDGAAGVDTEADVEGSLLAADNMLTVLRTLAIDLGLFRRGLLGAEHWWMLFAQFAQWAHFARLDYYLNTRRFERELLLDSVDALSDSLAEELLNPQRLRQDRMANREATEFETAVEEVIERLSWKVSRFVLQCFTREGCIDRLWSVSADTGAKLVLFSPDSVLHVDQAHRDRLAEIARSADVDYAVQLNFLTFFRMLTYGAFGPGRSFGREECRSLARDAGLVGLVWSAAVARPLNPRTAGSLRKDRDQLLSNGVPVEALSKPEWWERLEREFFRAADRGTSDSELAQEGEL